MNDDDFGPSQTPCDYCGATPSWRVDWILTNNKYHIWLCAECDNKELELLEFEDDDDDII